MEKLYDLKDKLCDNLDKSYEEIRRNPGRLSSGDLEYVRMLTDTIKNIGKIEMLEEEGGYSQEDGQDGGGKLHKSFSHNVLHFSGFPVAFLLTTWLKPW